MKKIYVLCLIIFFVFKTYAYEVKRVEIESDNINKKLYATIILPDSYNNSERHYSTIYLLHGWGGNDKSWTDKTNVSTLADTYQMIIVMPDGDYDKWYINSPVIYKSNYEKYIGNDVPTFIDNNFRTIASQSGRAITGLSMGGFGALNVALNYPKTFGAVGSMSGGVDPRDYPKNWGLEKVFGDAISNAKFWDDKAIINNAHQFISLNIPIYIDCGVNDFFIEPNRKLHKRLLELNINHNYLESPGGHSWDYWDNAVKYQLLFMKNVLEKEQAKMGKKQS
ncbi:XynC protein [Serratia sp. S1B]|nr:XynC protein [Serratia sp. S1B]